MNKTISMTCAGTLAAIIASGLWAAVVDLQHFLLRFVNAMFYIALPLIIVGGLMFLIERGVFNVTRYGFKRLFQALNKKQTAMFEEAEEQTDDRELLYQTHSFSWTMPILMIGIVLAVLSTAISFAVFV